ncbi:MAG: MFS transporter [Pseudomonadota bacterium]
MTQSNINRWIVFVLAGILFIMSQFYRSSVAVISPNLMQDMGMDALDLSRISAAFFYAFAVMQIPVGIFLDSVGPRIAMTALTLVSVVGAVLFALGTTPAWLTLGRALLGIGMACNFMGTLKLLTLWFEPKRFATLSAMIVSLGTLGNIVAATPLVLLVGLVGWRTSFLMIAGFTLAMSLLFLAVVRDRPGPSASDTLGTSENLPSISETLGRAWDLFHQRDYWIISLATFCRYGIYAAVQALWAGPFLIHVLDLSPVTAGNILFLMSIGLIIGCPVCGWLSDNWVHSRKKIVIAGICSMTGMLLAINCLGSGTSVWITASLFFLFGLASGSGQVMYAHIKEQVPSANAGMAMTGINFFTMAGVAVFLQGLGYVMKRFFPDASLTAPAFHLAFVLCCLCLTGIAFLYTLTHETLIQTRDDSKS